MQAFHGNLKGNLHSVTTPGALDVLPMQDEAVLKFLAVGAHAGGTTLGFQIEQYIHKRSSGGISVRNLKGPGRSCCWQLMPLLLLNPAAVPVMLQEQWPAGCAATGATPAAGRFCPGTFTHQIQAAFRETRLLVATDPRAITGLSDRRLVLTHLPLLCGTQILLCAVWKSPSRATRELAQWA